MKGIRVIDLTTALSGPFCTWLLASLGADVIKIEAPEGDAARTAPPFEDDISLYFASLNRNKRSIVLNLKTERDKAVLHKLLAGADVFVENMRPGVRNRLGCGDDDLKRTNPRLISASISGYGQTGSMAGLPAYDIAVQALSGMMSINGPMGGPPTRIGFSIGDIAASLFTTIGIMQRLYQRDAQQAQQTSHLDVSMLACQWACLENAFARYLNAGIVARPIGSRHPSMTPFETYPSADKTFVIALGSAKDWPRFCAAIGVAQYGDDPRFVSDADRLEHRDALDEILGAHFRQQGAQHWIDVLVANNIPCSIVENVASIAESDISSEYAAFSTVTTADGGDMRFVRNPIAARGEQENAAPTLGQHTDEILREIGFKP